MTIQYHVSRICIYCNSIDNHEAFIDGNCPICARMQPQEMAAKIEKLEKRLTNLCNLVDKLYLRFNGIGMPKIDL